MQVLPETSFSILCDLSSACHHKFQRLSRYEGIAFSLFKNKSCGSAEVYLLQAISVIHKNMTMRHLLIRRNANRGRTTI